MKLRDLYKANFVNDGSRSLMESILIPEVEQALRDWKQNSNTTEKCVLIGGAAIGYYTKPRMTVDSDLLFMAKEAIPMFVEKFKRTRPGAFLHKETHVEIEVLSPESINMDPALAKAIFDTSRVEDGIRIASPSGLIASKLIRFSRQDQADIESLYSLGNIDLSIFPLSDDLKAKFNKLVLEITTNK